MTDDLERRLEQLGSAPTSPMSVTAVHELEARLFATRRRQMPWRPLLATAAAVLLLAGAVFAMQRTDNGSLRPATAATSTVAATTATSSTSTTVAPTTSAATTTAPAPTTTAPPAPPTVPGGLPPGTPVATTPTGTAPPGTTPTTVPPTAPPTAPSTTLAPVVVPPASFTLSVQRVGDRLVFSWPAYVGGDGRQYVLVRVGPAGLNTWPVAQARIAAVVGRMNVTTTAIIQPNTESRRWVLAVVGENRTLIAVSSVAVSA